MATNFKTLKEYFYPDNGHRTFVVPNYQRGYKWSVRFDNEQTSVEYLMDSLLEAFKTPERQYFLQGVTVVEDGSNIILIDGQQRTTTLYLILWCLCLDYVTGTKDITLDYSIRRTSKDFINSLKNGPMQIDADHNDDVQDIFYFKEAILQIKEKIKDWAEEDCGDFYDFIMHKVSLLYIVIDKSKAVRTFTMMNGNKATMHDEELTKAEMLHLVSLPEPKGNIPEINNMEDTFALMKEMASIEWETNALRSKYAREWDKWLYWWNREDVKEFFNTRKPMGLLLEYYYRKNGDVNTSKGSKGIYSFNNFRKLMPDNDKKAAKDVFKGLRHLQKEFEDVFNNPLSFNYLKCAMIGSNSDNEDKYKLIMYFIEHKNDMPLLMRYARWRMIGSSHIETTEEYTTDPTNEEEGQYLNKEKRQGRVKEMMVNLSTADVYNNYSDVLFKQLLRLNVKEYNKLNDGKGVKFDFSFWNNNKSIEHIYPKSKVYHEEIDEVTGKVTYVNGAGTIVTDRSGLLNRNDFSDKSRYSEHCIGNLVLLYKRDNSEFNARSFKEKKALYFNTGIRFDSRNLLHTISSFANATWETADIETAAEKILTLLENDYKEVDYE